MSCQKTTLLTKKHATTQAGFLLIIVGNSFALDPIQQQWKQIIQYYLQNFSSISIGSPLSAASSSFSISTWLQSANSPI